MTEAIDRQFAANEAEEIRQMLKRAAQDIATIGQKLLAVKARLPHGEWGRWLGREFDWDERTAQRLMLVGQRFKNDNLSDLNIKPSTLYLLAAPNMPKNVAQAILDRARSGEKITRKDALDAIKRPETSVAKPDAELVGNVNAGPRLGPRVEDVVALAPASVRSNTPKAAADVSSDDDPRATFLNLGAKLRDEDGQWLREACELLLGKPYKAPRGYVGNSDAVFCAVDAQNALRRIQKNNPRRKEQFERTRDWIEYCLRELADEASDVPELKKRRK
jgi:hypothetical protein